MSVPYLRCADLDRRRAGLNRQLRNLRWPVADASRSGRVREPPALDLDSRRNFGASRSWLWDTCVDLAASGLFDAGGKKRGRRPRADG